MKTFSSIRHPRMTYAVRLRGRMPEVTNLSLLHPARCTHEKLKRLLETKKLEGKIEEEFSQSRGSGAEDRAMGWATLTINTPSTKLRKELSSFFQKLENDSGF